MSTAADPLDQAAPKAELATTEQITAEMLAAADRAFQENVEMHELRMTRLSICQGTTKEISGKVKGYQLGQIISSATREILSQYGPPPWLTAKGINNAAECHYLPVVPVLKLPIEYMEWVPKTEQKPGQSPIKWKTLNPKDERVVKGTYKTRGGQWDPGPENKAPPVVTACNYLFLPFHWETKEIVEGFAIGSFAKTSAPAGDLLTTQISNRRAQKIYSWDSVYFLYTETQPTAKGSTEVYRIAYAGLVKDIIPQHQSMVRQMAVTLSTEEGKKLQESMLNAAEVTGDHDEHPVQNSDTLDAAAAGSTEADEAFGDGTKQAF